MTNKKIIEKVEEWLKQDIASEVIPSAVRINSKVLLEYIENLKLKKDA